MKNSNSESNRAQRAIIYTRVLTDGQGESLRAQEERLRRYCSLNGITVVRHFESMEAAEHVNPPAFMEALTYCKEDVEKIDLLLFVKWGRFSRNIGELFSAVGEFQELGVTVQAIEQPVNLSFPENKLVAAFYCSIPD